MSLLYLAIYLCTMFYICSFISYTHRFGLIVFPMFYGPCNGVHLVSLGLGYSPLDGNIPPLNKGAPLLESCFNYSLVALVESILACIIGSLIHTCMLTLELSPRGHTSHACMHNYLVAL